MRIRLLGYIVFSIGLVSGCLSQTLLSTKDQESIKQVHQDKHYFLKQSFFVGPFFGYNDRHYISERAFDERVLIQNTSGDPIFPAQASSILPLGTKVKIQEIEFPDGYAMSSRKLKSPRHFTWVLLNLVDQPAKKPFVLVLARQFAKKEEFTKALSFYLADDNPTEKTSSFSPAELQAINQKTLIKGMNSEQLKLSRGQPDQIIRKFIKGTKVEHWTYAPNRIVVLKEDSVDSWKGFPEQNLEAFSATNHL
jgi:hypothetical protein